MPTQMNDISAKDLLKKVRHSAPGREVVSYREFALPGSDAIASQIDTEAREIKDLLFSTDNIVEMPYGPEVLSHDPGAVDLSYFEAGAPFLVDHDRHNQIGVVLEAVINAETGEGRARLKVSQSRRAEDYFLDIRDGIRTMISVGYEIIDAEMRTIKGVEVLYVTRWRPLEVSSVSMAADISAGLGRSNQKEREIEMPEIKENPPAPTPPPAPAPPVVDVSAALEADRRRAAEIEEIAARFKMVEQGKKAAREGMSVDQFRALVVDHLDNNPVIQTQEAALGLTPKEARAYNIGNAIRAAITGDWKTAGFEAECSRAVAKLMNKEPQGFFMPYDVMISQERFARMVQNVQAITGQRDISSTAAAALIATENRPADFIELLRNEMVLSMAGARVLTGLSSNVSIPRQDGAATAAWIDPEGTAVTPADQTFASLSLGPKEVMAATNYGKKALLQSNPSLDDLILTDLIEQLARAVDKAGLDGAGASGEPTGVKNTSGVGTVTGTSLAWAGVVEFETDVAAANAARLPGLAWITTAAVRGLLKTRAKETGYPVYLWENDEMNGYRGLVTEQTPASHLFFGAWSQVILAFFGGLDIVVNPYALDLNAKVRITAYQGADVGVRHPAAFSMATAVT